ncbi:MAG: beta-lactamase family protein [Actinomycetia bacterium]|nr:beta-lactamase family protein [Actinomycetes bacterium]
MTTNTTRPEAVGMSSDRLDRIGTVMQCYVDDGVIAGASTMISRRGQIVHSEQVGHRDREADLAMTPDTIFRIYSMTKPIVSTALMLLHEEARFQLEHPVAQYLPAFGATPVLEADGSLVAQARPMEIRDLLTHTSGLTYDFMEDTPVGEMYRQARIMNDASRTLEDAIDTLAEIPLATQPGARWHYSVGIDVAARLIEVISGQSLGDFLKERIFDPLGMPDTGFSVADSELDRVAAMYGLPDLVGEGHTASALVEAALSGFNERIDVSATYPTSAPGVWARGGLGLFSTTDDYMRFAQMMLNRGELDGTRVVGRKTLELMHTNHLPADLMPFELVGRLQGGLGFGLGSRVMLDVAASAGPGSVGEYGWAGAAKTYYFVDPAEELVGLFMSQYMTGVQLPDRDMRSLTYQAIID